MLEKGRIVESGNHLELLEQRGLYYAMWRQQIGERRDPAGPRAEEPDEGRGRHEGPDARAARKNLEGVSGQVSRLRTSLRW